MRKYVPTKKELLITLGIIILIAWGTWMFCSGLKPNEFGDAINPLLGAITIALVYGTYKLQEKELHETTETLQKQEQVMQEQRFQDNFFRLIELFNQHRRKYIFKQKNKDTGERYSFEDILPKFLDGIRKGYIFYTTFPGSDINDEMPVNFNENETDIIIYYKNIMNRKDQGKSTQSFVIQYMQLIIQLQKLISKSTLDSKRKVDFNDLIQSILSEDEKVLIEIHTKSGIYPTITN